MTFRLRALLLLALAAASVHVTYGKHQVTNSVASGSSFLRLDDKSPSVAPLLSLRGGDVPALLNPTDTAKLGTLLAGTHAALTLLSPSRMMEVYGNPTGGPVLELLSGYQGVTILGFALQASALILGDADLKTAVGYSTIPYTLYSIKVLWNQDHKAIGMPGTRQWTRIVIGAIVAHACFTDASYVDNAIKFHAITCIADGVMSALLPGTLVEAWKLEASEVHNLYMRMRGAVILGLGVYQAALVWGVDPMKAFAYAWIPQLLFQISACFITKDYDKHDVSKGPAFLWMLIDVLVIAACGFQKGIEHHEGSSPL